MTNIQIRGKIAYLAQDHLGPDGRQVREYIRPLDQDELREYRKSMQTRQALVPVSCCNPKCDQIILIPRDQKQKFFTTYPLRYGRFTLPYCSKKCQDDHTRELSPLTEQSH
ncbi:MAG: hypothetical protein HF975_04525 [ANME-2 cluster archaeon]|nr:hypothetical protein [ANME-2 cluster archaeon]